MHSFTIALISTLSLGVHAASIGDSVSQLVTREQHNRLFHNPDFTSANPAAESFERAGKISPREFTVDSATAVGRLLSGMLATGINNRPNTANTNAQTVVDTQASQAFAVPSLGALGDLLSGMLAFNTRPNTANSIPLNGQTVVDTQAAAVSDFLSGMLAVNTRPNTANTLNAQAAVDTQASTNAQAAQAAAIIAQAVINAQAAINAQAPTNNAQAAIMAQAAANAQAADNAQAAIVAQAAINGQVNAQNPGALPNVAGLGIGSISANAGAQQNSPRDAVKRQISVPTNLPGSVAQAANNTGLALREDNTKFSDGQVEVEDMDFSAHDSEADELEEDF